MLAPDVRETFRPFGEVPLGGNKTHPVDRLQASFQTVRDLVGDVPSIDLVEWLVDKEGGRLAGLVLLAVARDRLATVDGEVRSLVGKRFVHPDEDGSCGFVYRLG